MLRAGVALLALLALTWAEKHSTIQFLAAGGTQKEAATATAVQESDADEGEVEYKASNVDADAETQGSSVVQMDEDEDEDDEDEDADVDEDGEEDLDEGKNDADENEDEHEDEHEDGDAGEGNQHMMLEQQSLAGAWQDNAQTPVWKVLQQQLMAQYDERQLAHYTAVTVPATLVFAMSAYEQKILEPARRDGKGVLNIHLIGSTYLYEGLSDWNVLAKASPPDMHTVNVHLILGTPFQRDGKVQDKTGESIHFDDNLPETQTKLHRSFIQISPNKKYGAKELRSKTCRSFTHGSTTVNVLCHEKLYQNVMNEIPTPHFAFMSNPGFPLPYRRFYDGVLIHLLEKSIPSVISAQMFLPKGGMEELVAAKGDAHAWSMVSAIMNREKWFDEAYQCSETVKSFGATVDLHASPFPYAYHDRENDGDGWMVKNAVIEFFSGRAAGASKIELLPALENDMDDNDRKSANPVLVSALLAPVSRPFAQAMRAWAQQTNKDCVDAVTAKDWIACCKTGDC